MIADGHAFDKIIEYDFRQFIYFVNASKKLHNSRQIEQFNLQMALRGGEKQLKDYIKSVE